MTTEYAATTAPSPIVTPDMIVALVPIQTSFPIVTGPFDEVISTDPLQFPDRVPANADLAARLDSLQTLVIAAILIGALALLVSVGGLAMRRR